MGKVEDLKKEIYRLEEVKVKNEEKIITLKNVNKYIENKQSNLFALIDEYNNDY